MKKVSGETFSHENIHRAPSVGELGESIACRYLDGLGYAVLERNYRKVWGEIDIIAEKEGAIHFVEVKSVSRELSEGSGRGINPADNLHERKLLRLQRVIQSYLTEKGIGDSWQLDAILVFVDVTHKKAQVELLEHIG